MRIIFVSSIVLTIGYVNSRVVFWTIVHKEFFAITDVQKHFIMLREAFWMKYCHLIFCLILTTFSSCRVGHKLTFEIIQYLKPKEGIQTQKLVFFKIYINIFRGSSESGRSLWV